MLIKDAPTALERPLMAGVSGIFKMVFVHTNDRAAGKFNVDLLNLGNTPNLPDLQILFPSWSWLSYSNQKETQRKKLCNLNKTSRITVSR